jgi:hypothetical protein
MDWRNPRRPWQKRALTLRCVVSTRIRECWCYTKRTSTIPRAHGCLTGAASSVLRSTASEWLRVLSAASGSSRSRVVSAAQRPAVDASAANSTWPQKRPGGAEGSAQHASNKRCATHQGGRLPRTRPGVSKVRADGDTDPQTQARVDAGGGSGSVPVPSTLQGWCVILPQLDR